MKVGTTKVSSQLISLSTHAGIGKKLCCRRSQSRKDGAKPVKDPQGFTPETHAAWLDGEGEEDGLQKGSPHHCERRLNRT